MKKKKILIVDDDEEICKMLSIFIEGLGYQAESKENVISAKKWLSSNQPDLMLIDIKLPDATGIDLCRWINSHTNLKNIPIIHMSTISDDIAKQDSLFSGAVAFIIKPFDFKLVESKIKMFLDKESKPRNSS